jgi:Mrp family chromosome partitioning ATPase
VIVVRLNKTTRDTAARLREQLATIGVDPLGVVVNAIQTRRGGYYYYGYGDDSGRSRDSKPVQPPVESQLGDAPESLPIATGPD